MLKKRVITACLLLPWVVSVVLFLPSSYFAIISGLIFLGAIWEWTYLAGFQSIISRIGCLLLLFFGTLLFMIILNQLGEEMLKEGLSLFIVVFWLLVLYSLYHYPRSFLFSKSRMIGLISGGLALVPAYSLLVVLKNMQDKGSQYVLYILILVWVVDSSAYFIGKRFGKHKLAPLISPGKTWEGALGSCAVSFLVMFPGYLILQPNKSLLNWLILGILSVIFSIVGDLFESAYKRVRNVKDSGTILPGHGGILDRIDSLTAAIPIFTIGFMFFN